MADQIEIIPELRNVNDALIDIIFRVQQTLIGLQVYHDKLSEVQSLLPGLQIEGYNLTQLPLGWGVGKTPESLKINLERSVTFCLLNALNLNLYLIDSLMFTLAKKYYNLQAHEDDTWVTSEVFELLTGIKLNELQYNDSVVELRRICGQIRQLKKTHSITINEFFELYQRLSSWVGELSRKVSEKVHKDNLIKRLTEGKDNLTNE